MKYGVVSDSHDHFYNLDRSVEIFRDRGVSTVFHLGDFCAPGFFRAMSAHIDMHWVCVWGNVDADKAKILLEFGNTPNLEFTEYNFREYEADGAKVFLTHFPKLGELAAKSGEYRAVFYGDDHKKHQEVLSSGTLLANPGELSGFASGQPSCGIWDSESNQQEILDLPDFKISR